MNDQTTAVEPDVDPYPSYADMKKYNARELRCTQLPFTTCMYGPTIGQSSDSTGSAVIPFLLGWSAGIFTVLIVLAGMA